MKKVIVFLIIFFFSSGCVRTRDYLSVNRGAVRLNVVVPLGTGTYSKDYLVVGKVVVDKGDSSRLVKQKLGSPSYIGVTIEGYQFYRYDEQRIEIYFDDNRVIGWTKLDFRP